MAATTTQPTTSLLAFESAREAVTKLETLRPLLSRADEETIAILMDKKLLQHLDQSVCEARAGKLAPLARIVK